MIKVGSIIEILNHGSVDDYVSSDLEYYMRCYPIGSQHVVLEYHQETGEIEIHHNPYAERAHWHTFFPGEYKLVE